MLLTPPSLMLKCDSTLLSHPRLQRIVPADPLFEQLKALPPGDLIINNTLYNTLCCDMDFVHAANITTTHSHLLHLGWLGNFVDKQLYTDAFFLKEQRFVPENEMLFISYDQETT